MSANGLKETSTRDLAHPTHSLTARYLARRPSRPLFSIQRAVSSVEDARTTRTMQLVSLPACAPRVQSVVSRAFGHFGLVTEPSGVDGVTDDTTSIQNFINANWGCKILYFDAGTYKVTNTITIPTGSIVVGEIWTTIIGLFSPLLAPGRYGQLSSQVMVRTLPARAVPVLWSKVRPNATFGKPSLIDWVT